MDRAENDPIDRANMARARALSAIAALMNMPTRQKATPDIIAENEADLDPDTQDVVDNDQVQTSHVQSFYIGEELDSHDLEEDAGFAASSGWHFDNEDDIADDHTVASEEKAEIVDFFEAESVVDDDVGADQADLFDNDQVQDVFGADILLDAGTEMVDHDQTFTKGKAMVDNDQIQEVLDAGTVCDAGKGLINHDQGWHTRWGRRRHKRPPDHQVATGNVVVDVIAAGRAFRCLLGC